jgi:hypothetical protein
MYAKVREIYDTLSKELNAEQIRCGDAFHVALRDPKGLWEDLVQRSERARNLIRT